MAAARFRVGLWLLQLPDQRAGPARANTCLCEARRGDSTCFMFNQRLVLNSWRSHFFFASVISTDDICFFFPIFDMICMYTMLYFSPDFQEISLDRDSCQAVAAPQDGQVSLGIRPD